MMIDFSLLKNIDFTNTDNLIFLSIFLVIVIIVFFIFIVVLVEIIKVIKKAIIKIFNIDTEKTEFGIKESTNQLQDNKEAEKRPSEYPSIPKQQAIGVNLNIAEKKSEEEQKTSVKSYKEKEEKGITEGLSKLKSGGSAGGDTLESKMPSRTGGQEEDDKFKPIKIPTPKRLAPSNITPEVKYGGTPTGEINSKLRGQPLTYEKESGINSAAGSLKIPVAGKGTSKQQAGQDTSIFGGQSEISRIKLEQEMKTDTNVWQASRQSGLNLSPVERAKLVKEVFSSALGRNISKTDLKSGITKLNRKMLNSKDSTEHAKIRKEIKFFKKIGGIK